MNPKQKKTILIIIAICVLTAIAAGLVIAILLNVGGKEEREEQRYVMQGTSSYLSSEAEQTSSNISKAESASEENSSATNSVTENNSVMKNVPVESISLSVYEVNLEVGHSQMPIVTMGPENATDKSEIWSSDNEGIATVNEEGRITGVAPGKCTVTVTSASNPNVSEKIDVTISAAQTGSASQSSAPSSGASSSGNQGTGSSQSAPSQGSGNTSGSGNSGSGSGSSSGSSGTGHPNGITDAMIADFNARAPHIIQLAYDKLSSIDCVACPGYIDISQDPNNYAFQTLPESDLFMCNWADSSPYSYSYTDEECADILIEEVLTTRRLYGLDVCGVQFEYLGVYYEDSSLGINYWDGYPNFRVLCFMKYQ